MEKRFETKLGDKSLVVETGLAPQANAALKLTYGETVVLVTAVLGKNIKNGTDYLPLTVEYEEKMYAAGRMKGSRFIKREGRATDEAVLTGRLIDRIIRPSFDQKIRNDIQVVATVLSFDGINDPDILSIIGASLVLSISNIPWRGPLSAVRVGKIDGKFIINPSYEERKKSLIDLTFASDGEVINMIEFGSDGADNKEIMDGIEYGLKEIKQNIVFQTSVAKEIGQKKQEIRLVEIDEKIIKKAEGYLDKNLPSVFGGDKLMFQENLDKAYSDYIELFAQEIKESDNPSLFKDGLMIFFEKKVDEMVHVNILKNNDRPDGRKLDEIRELGCQVGILPRTHGSGLFKRGLTHVLSIVTLANPSEEQLLDGMEIVGSKGFMHHYNFPPFSVGETGFFRGPGRREIGHGALAEKALIAVMPSKDKFPYTIRIVSEVLSSNGSSSMASACGSTLALLDAGVPIKESVAGIAMGLMIDEKDTNNYKILTDIQGPEDHYGDIDLKVAGTKEKVTAMQMDVKIDGISEKVLGEALEQAHKARKEILELIDKTINSPRKELSQYAPKIMVLKIEKEQIGEVIGGGGRTINGIIEKTGTNIDINDDGKVYVSGEKLENVQAAFDIIKNMTKRYEAGEIADGVISRVLEFGAFAKISPVHEGLIHVSKLAPYRVENVRDIVHEGDRVKVEVTDTDELGRINFRLIENFDRKPTKNSSGSFVPDRKSGYNNRGKEQDRNLGRKRY